MTVRFGDTVAVDDVDLAVPAGTVLAVLGPSGCGKSTLLRAVAGLERPTAGTTSYDGHDLARTPVHRRGFALMFQDGQLFPHLDVAANVAYPLRLRRVPRDERRGRVDELLDLVGLEGYDDREVTTLSGGERQRVALARALAVEPRMLLLDEPLSALDRGLRERLATELREILAAAGVTAMLVTHDHEEAFAVADRMAVMRDGPDRPARLARGGLEPPRGRLDRPVPGLRDRARRRGRRRGSARWPRRRSAGPPWRCAARRCASTRHGPLTATVTEARVTPEQMRLELEVDGIGPLPGVADRGSDVAVGALVRLSLDRSRLAALSA